jgi:hypothetical protein
MTKMEKFSIVKAGARSVHMASMQNWVERFVCRPAEHQRVVGNRDDGYGSKVSQLMFDNASRWAHVCPFVRDSLDYDVFWIEETPYTASQGNEIKEVLRAQTGVFKTSAPSFDPLQSGEAKLPALWKTFFTIFPAVECRSRKTKPFPLFDEIHKELKPEFVSAGLMLGQFYPNCPQPGVYNEAWIRPLVSPYPAFAIRYMAKHDHLFISKDSREYKSYQKFFPERSVA